MGEWLEDDPFLLGFGSFSGALAVSFTECNGWESMILGWGDSSPLVGEVEKKNNLKLRNRLLGHLLMN